MVSANSSASSQAPGFSVSIEARIAVHVSHVSVSGMWNAVVVVAAVELVVELPVVVSWVAVVETTVVVDASP